VAWERLAKPTNAASIDSLLTTVPSRGLGSEETGKGLLGGFGLTCRDRLSPSRILVREAFRS